MGRKKYGTIGYLFNRKQSQQCNRLTDRPKHCMWLRKLFILHGLDYAAQEADVKTMYENPEARDSLLEKYNVTYIVIGPWENGSYSIPDINAFAKNYDCIYNKNGILVFEV